MVRGPRGRLKLPESAYVPSDELLVPDCVSDLEKVPGVCHSLAMVVLECRADVGRLCRDCSAREVGEPYALLIERTNKGISKGKFYRDLEGAQAAPDPVFARAQARSVRRFAQG